MSFFRIPAILLLLSAPAAQAHDLWLTPGADGILHVHYGHPGEAVAPSADKLVTLSAFTHMGARALTAAPASDGAPVLRASLGGDGAGLVAASYDNGYWVRLKDGGYRNASKRLVPDAEKSQWSMKFAKAVLGPEAPYDRVVGHTLEIVPLEAPSAAKERIRVRVLFEGRPATGSLVTAGDGVNAGREADLARATTDGDGIATVPLRQAGPQVLEVNRRVAPSATPTLADVDAYTATLAFTVVDPRTN